MLSRHQSNISIASVKWSRHFTKDSPNTMLASFVYCRIKHVKWSRHFTKDSPNTMLASFVYCRIKHVKWSRHFARLSYLAKVRMNKWRIFPAFFNSCKYILKRNQTHISFNFRLHLVFNFNNFRNESW